jgi:predicted ArsR family transcriptional regulator
VPNDDLDTRLASVAALADPLRRSLYRYVAAQTDPVTRDQAAHGVGVARHVAKFHLDRLVDDGLLDVDYRRPPGRRGPGAGRPAKVYRRSDRQVEVSLPERRYELAADVLARAVVDARRQGVPVEEAVRRSAREAGRDLGDEARRALEAGATVATGAREAAAAVLARQGYEPRDDADGLTLLNCPFHRLARDYTDLVCGMNADFLAAVLDGLGIDELEAVLDPAPSRCCVRLVERSVPKAV